MPRQLTVTQQEEAAMHIYLRPCYMSGSTRDTMQCGRALMWCYMGKWSTVKAKQCLQA